MKQITFGELRKVLSRINRLSICDKETLSYENFETVRDVPETYDDLIVCGIGTIESEFKRENLGVTLMQCIEIMTIKEKEVC